jgi:hypothetical protein
LFSASGKEQGVLDAMKALMQGTEPTSIKNILKDYAGDGMKLFQEFKAANAKCLERTFNAKSGARCLACSTEPGQKNTVIATTGTITKV